MPDPGWSPDELAAIERWMSALHYTREAAEAAVLRTRPKTPKGPEAPGERTPTEERADILQAALDKLEIRLGPNEFAAFLKDTHAAFGLQKAQGKFDGTWQQFLDSLSSHQREVPVAEGMATELFPSPLENYLGQWRELQEEQRATEQEAKERGEGRDKALTKAFKVEIDLEDARFQDALGDLGRRYPANKSLIKALTPYALQAWRTARQRARDEFDSLPPELREGMGWWQPPDIPANTFVQTYDWAEAASQSDVPGMGEMWQQGLFRDAFNANVADPMRAAAKTPAEKLSVEAQIAKLEALVTPALQAQFLEAAKAQPGLDMNQYLQTDAAKAIVGEATRSLQNRIQPGQAATAAQRFAQKVDAIYDMTLRGYDPAFIAQSLDIAESAVTRIAEPARVIRQFQVSAASLSQGGFVQTPAGEVRTGEFGETAVPQSVRQYTQTPVTAQQLGARNAALNALTGGEWGKAQYGVTVAEANQWNLQAGALALRNEIGTLEYQIGQALGRPYSSGGISNPAELRGILASAQATQQSKQQQEAYRTTALEVLKPAFDDPVFAKELDYFTTKNAKITQAAAFDAMPDIYETREQVMVRMAPEVARMYDEYLAKKKQAPSQLPTPMRVL